MGGVPSEAAAGETLYQSPRRIYALFLYSVIPLLPWCMTRTSVGRAMGTRPRPWC